MPTKRKQTDKTRTQAPGVISPSEIYSKREFMARVGWKEDAWRTAKRNGLKTVVVSRRVYIIGKAFLEYLETMSASTASAESLN